MSAMTSECASLNVDMLLVEAQNLGAGSHLTVHPIYRQAHSQSLLSLLGPGRASSSLAWLLRLPWGTSWGAGHATMRLGLHQRSQGWENSKVKGPAKNRLKEKPQEGSEKDYNRYPFCSILFDSYLLLVGGYRENSTDLEIGNLQFLSLLSY